MKLILAKESRVKDNNIETSCFRYQSLIKKYCDVESITRFKFKAATKDNYFIVGLDSNGKEYESIQLSKQISIWSVQNPGKSLLFVIGGPYGLSESIKEHVDGLWSLSKATLAGDVAWLVVWEQIYRAISIMHNHPYHHE